MNLKFLQPLTRLIGKSGLVISKFSPEIFTGVGIVGGIVTTVLACKATLKLEPEIELAKAQIEWIRKDRYDSLENQNSYGRDLTMAYMKAAFSIIRHYAVPLSVGAVSISCVLVGHNILQKRNAALVAAYNAVEAAYQNYRAKVREEHGEDADKKLYAQSIAQNAKDKDGKKIASAKDMQPSGHGRVFDKYNPNWNSGNPELNVYFLRCQQTYMNDILRSKGFLTLNEVYRALGFDETSEGLVLGWVLDKNRKCFVDFGMYSLDDESTNAFLNGSSDAIWLNFNVDGVIWDRF